MTAHLHSVLIDGCFRCDLGRDEAFIPEHARCTSIAPSAATSLTSAHWTTHDRHQSRHRTAARSVRRRPTRDRGDPVNRIAPYAKAFIGAAVAGLGAASVALDDGSISGKEWVAVATAALVALGAIWGVPNKEN